MQQPAVRPASQATLLIIYGSFISACFVYAGIILSGLLDNRQNPNPPSQSTVLIGCLATALLMTFAGIMYGRWRKLPESPASEFFLMIVQTRMIIQAFCFELVAILGFAGYLLGLPQIQSLAFIAASVLLLLTLLPGLRANIEQARTSQSL